MSKPLKTVHLILVTAIVGGVIFAIDAHYLRVAKAEKVEYDKVVKVDTNKVNKIKANVRKVEKKKAKKQALDLMAGCFGFRESNVEITNKDVKITVKCTENTMVLSELRKGRDDT
jgi:vacuolar-type H+-ATPase subunit B/Vma2